MPLRDTVRKDIIIRSKTFSDDYMEVLFTSWYNHGKPTAQKFLDIIKEEIGADEQSGGMPTIYVVRGLIRDIFAARAYKLDEETSRQLENLLVAERMKMLKRHAEVGKAMQDKALSFLEDHEFEDSKIAVRALVEGIRIEKDSSGLSGALEKLSTASDEKLLQELKNLVLSSPIQNMRMLEDGRNPD